MNSSIIQFQILILGSLFLISCSVPVTPIPSPTNTPKPSYDAIVDAQFAGIEGAMVNGVKTYKKIESALNAAPENSTQPYRIFIKNGRYYEKLNIAKPFIAFI